MTRDPLDLLRSANPVPQPTAYGEDEVTRRVADILDRDGQTDVLIEDVPVRSHPRWLAAGLAAAAVLVLAVVSAVVLTRGSSDNTAAGASPVTCVVSTSGSTKVVRERLTQAEAVISSRMKQLNGTARSFVTDQGDGTVGFTPSGVTITKAAKACQAATVAIRPVVTRPVAVDSGSPRLADPLEGLPFAIPPTAAAWVQLSPVRRAQLSAAMSHYDCVHPSSAAAPGLTCFTLPGRTQILLVGPALIAGPDVSSAFAAPNPAAGSGAQWIIDLSFRAAGAARFQAFTAKFHTSDSSASLSSCGESGPVPCADFLAITVDGRAVAVPVTNAVLDSAVQISGAFDRSSAQFVADDCTAASIGLRPR